VAAALAAVALAGACGGDPGTRDALARERATGYRGVALERPVPMPDVTLEDTRGRPFDFREQTEGTVTLLFFGYTNCPDVCPAQMANLGAVYDELPPHVRQELKVVFVTADPRRDSGERMRRWLDRFGESFVGLRGGDARVDSLQSALGLSSSVKRVEGGGPAGAYTVEHSTAVLAFTPDGAAHLAYPFGTRQRDWAHDLPRLVEEGWRPAGGGK
jgi:protein SCO1/2